MSATETRERGAPEPLRQGGRDARAPAGRGAAGALEDNTPSRREVIAIIGGLALGMFLGALNQTIVATALPTIGRTFNDFENLSWVVIAYLLTSTVVAPLYGKLSDIYGRRVMMLVALGIFMAGSVVAAVAPSMIILIVGRGLQGFGGGGIVPLAQSTIADTVPPRERGYYQAYTGSVWLVAGALGPFLGGYISQHMNWSLIFWLNLPLGVAAALLSNRQLKRLPQHPRAHKLDLFGATLMMASAMALLLALTWGGTRYPWLSRETLSLVATAVVIAGVFLWWVLRTPEPFLPVAVLTNPIMRVGTFATSCTQGVNIGLTIYVPLYYEMVHGLSASDSGLALIPIVMMTTPGSYLSGRAMLHLDHYKFVPIVLLSFTVAAVGLLAFYPLMPVWLVACIMCLVGFGTGSSYPVVTVSIQNAVAHEQVGVAMGTMNFFRALAASLIVAVMGTIMLTHLGTSPERTAGAAMAAATGAAARELVHTFGIIFMVAAGILVMGITALLIMEERPLRTTLFAAPAGGSATAGDAGKGAGKRAG